MAAFVAAEHLAEATQALAANGLAPVRIGEIIRNDGERVIAHGRLRL
jgi:hypothetical protein